MAHSHLQSGPQTTWELWFIAVRDRIIWALCIAVVMMIALIYFFSPPHLIGNIFDYLGARLVLEFRSLPLFGVRKSDLIAVALSENKIAAQQLYWYFYSSVSFGVALAFFAGSIALLLRKRKLTKSDRVVRGAELVTVKEHNRQMRRQFGKKPPNIMGAALELGSEKTLVPEALQYLHFAFCGASGCGKSTAIEEIISHGQRYGHKGFVIDLGGAFYSKFGRPGDHVLSLRDPRSKRWDFWGESHATPENIAAAMIEEDRFGTRFFWTAARGLWASLLRQNKTVEGVFASLMKPTASLQSELAKMGELAARVLGEGKGNQADGVLGTTALDMTFLRELNQWAEEKERFSITEWMADNSDASWVYVLVNDADLEVAKPILRVWFELAALAILNREPGNPNNLQTWLIVDELKTVGQLPSLPALLDKGRKFSASVALGFQAVSQVKKIYGEDDARSILQGIQNQFYFRMSEVESAQYVSDSLGDQDVEQATVSTSFGPHDTGTRGTVSRSLVHRKLVLPEEVQRLETLQAIAKLSGQRPVKLRFAPQQRVRRQAGAISNINTKKVREFTERVAAMHEASREKQATVSEAAIVHREAKPASLFLPGHQ